MNMHITTISSREFNQDTSAAKRASLEGPVFITDRGHTKHVLLTIENYEKLTGKEKNIIELVGMAEVADIPFDPEPANIVLRPAEFE